MRVAVVKIGAVGVAVCHGCVPVPMLVPAAGCVERHSVGMIVMALVMTMPMGVFLWLVLVFVLV